MKALNSLKTTLNRNIILITTLNVSKVCKQHQTSRSIIMQSKTGIQNMNHSSKSVLVIQNFVSASPNEGYKAGADTISIDIPSLRV